MTSTTLAAGQLRESWRRRRSRLFSKAFGPPGPHLKEKVYLERIFIMITYTSPK